MQFEEFAHQTVLITGAASGIGAAQCQAFLDQGASVIAIDQQPMPKAHAQLLTFEGSVTDMAFIQASVTEGVAHLEDSIWCATRRGNSMGMPTRSQLV